jgi:hypothetical protein
MHNWQCCCSAVHCCALWYWQLRGKVNVTFLYTYSYLFGHIRKKEMTWIGPSQFKFYLANIITVNVVCIPVRVLLNIAENFPPPVLQCTLIIVGLLPQNNRHFKLKPAKTFSQTLWPSYPSQAICGSHISRRIQPSPPVSRNALIYAHVFAQRSNL